MSWLIPPAASLTASMISSGAATDGQVLTADGAGAAAWESLPSVYAGISASDNATETTISTAGVAVQVTIFDTNQPSSGATPDHTNDHITIDTTGVYYIECSATLESVAGASSRAEITVAKNNGGTTKIIPHVDRNLAGGGGSSGSVSMHGIASLTANDTIEVWIENETNTQNYIVQNISLTVLKL